MSNEAGICLVDNRTRTNRACCPGCQDRLAGQLRELVESYALLAGELLPGATVQDGTRRTKGEPPLPGREDVISARGPGEDTLAGFLFAAETEVRDFFDLTWPTFRGTTGQTVVGAAEFLLVWMDRMANDWGNIGAFARGEGTSKGVFGWHKECRRMLGDQERTFSPGSCPLLVEQPDGSAIECGGRLVVDAYGQGAVNCRSCRAEWPRSSWLVLGGELPDPRTA